MTFPRNWLRNIRQKGADHSRLMVLNRKDRVIEHRLFLDITDYLKEGDVLVLNDTSVIPARLLGRKQTGAKTKVFLLRQLSNGSDHESVWHCLVSSRKKPRHHTKILFDRGLAAEIMDEADEAYRIRFTSEGSVKEELTRAGRMPLSPYIRLISIYSIRGVALLKSYVIQKPVRHPPKNKKKL